MGYARFSANEEEVMDAFMRYKSIQKKKIRGDYPHQIKSLLRKKMIKPQGKTYMITERGKNAITQHHRGGEYWVAPLASYRRLNTDPE